MSEDFRVMKCSKCGEPIKVPWTEDSHLCDNCDADLDARIAADDAEVNAMLEDTDMPLSSDLLTNEVPTSQQLLERQRNYTTEDHKWNMER